MFDTARFLATEFGDFHRTYALLSGYGYEVEKMAVYQWHHRASVGTKWVLTLLALKEIETGQPVSLVKYLK